MITLKHLQSLAASLKSVTEDNKYLLLSRVMSKKDVEKLNALGISYKTLTKEEAQTLGLIK